MHDRKTLQDINSSGRVKCIHDTCVDHEVSIGGYQNKWVEEVNQKQQRKSYLSSFLEGWQFEKNCRKLKADKKKSVATDSMGTSSVDKTTGSVFSAVRVSSMRLADMWLCDSGASHHLIANKQYFITYKRFAAPVSISLEGKGTILPCGFGHVNIEILVDEVVHWLLGTRVLRSRYWKTPVPSTECDRTRN